MSGTSVASAAARGRLARALLIALTLLAVLASPAGAQGPAPALPVTVDGPSPDIVGLSGLSTARDGTGGVVYLKQVLGVPHVFVSRLLGGVFQAPEQVDGALLGASSQPVIAAGNGGLLLIAFINAGHLYVVERASTSAASGSPIQLFNGATDPAIQMTAFGKAYLAFDAAGDGGHDVRSAYYYNGHWALEPAALDAVPADDAGTGTGRPRVAAAGDGVAIVVWGEAGHIYSRRVWDTSPSVVYEQADVPSLSGWSEVSADLPTVSVGGDSSYADVAFHELLSSGALHQSRVLMRRLRGSRYESATQPDGLSTPASGGAEEPQVVIGEYGRGLVTSARDDSNQLFAMLLGNNGASGPVTRMDSLQNAAPPEAVPALAGLYSDLIAWQQDPGSAGMPEIRVRYSRDGSTFGSELVVSSPSLGPTVAASGLAAAGDISGDAVIAWVQGTGSSTRIVADQLYQPPGSFSALSSFRYVRSSRPVLAWSPAPDDWGPVRYVVTLDGSQLSQTGAASVRVPAPLPDGRHTWQVTAVNPAGLTTAARAATVWVDTVAPVARLALGGRRRTGSVLHIYVTYSDSPPPEPPGDASGIAEVVVNWGDGSVVHIRHGKYHAYERPGRYKLTVVVKDRAGNATKLVRSVRISSRHPAPATPRRRRSADHGAGTP